jgi:hypothetical protein
VLHVFCPVKGGKRKKYGGTISLGLKRGSLVKHRELGLCYVSGTSNNRISLHDLRNGFRLGQRFNVGDCRFLVYNIWGIVK